MITFQWIILFVLFFTLDSDSYRSQTIDQSVKVKDVRASSVVPDKNFSYSPIHLVDNSPKSWCMNRKYENYGTHDGFLIEFEKEKEMSKIIIKNGYGDQKYFHRNNRVKELALAIFKKRNWIILQSFELKDTNETQVLTISQPLKTNEVNFMIKSVYKGDKDNDTCITEIGFDLEEFSFTGNQKRNLSETKKLEFDAYEIEPKSNGTLKGSGYAYCQCNCPFVKGFWGDTNDGQSYLKMLFKISKKCGNADGIGPEGDELIEFLKIVPRLE